LPLDDLRAAVKNGVAVHYACSNLYRKPVRISCISVYDWQDDKTQTFVRESTDDQDEARLLEEFFMFATTLEGRKVVTWNMKDSTFGVQVLQKRYNELTSKHVDLNLRDWLDIDQLLGENLGWGYARDPKLYNLARTNGMNLIGYRLGPEEADLFEKGNFRTIEVSCNRKVRLLKEIAERALRNDLQTNVIFVVHGHDTKRRDELTRFLRHELGLKAFYLAEKPDRGLTIIEKFENYAGFATAAIVLLTPDDRTYIPNTDEMKRRARQNVILELGYFFGKLGRERVILLFKEGTEIPSDIYGILYLPFKEISSIKRPLAKELRERGILAPGKKRRKGLAWGSSHLA